MPRKRTISSGAWQGLSAEVRAGLHAAEQAGRVLEALDAYHATVGVELAGEAQRGLRALLLGALRESFLAGTAREAELDSALALEHGIRVRLELALREAGLEVPTDPIESELPPAR